MTLFIPIILILACVAVLALAVFFAWNDYLSPTVIQQQQRLKVIKIMNTKPITVGLQFKRVLSHNERVATFIKGIPYSSTLDKLLMQAGIQYTMDRMLIAALAIFAIVFATGTFFSIHFILITLASLGVSALLVVYLVFRKNNRRNLIDDQLPEALDMISQTMLAGHALNGAILLASSEASEPIASELRYVVDEINYGISARNAILALTDRIDSEFIRLFVASVLIQIDTGGNMADILKNTSFIIRERKKFKASTRSLTAEVRLSALILGCLPFFIIGLLSVINPGFMSVLWKDDLGMKFMMASVLLMALGSLWLWRLIKTPF